MSGRFGGRSPGGRGGRGGRSPGGRGGGGRGGGGRYVPMMDDRCEVDGCDW